MTTPIDKRYCLILEMLRQGRHVIWTKRRLARIINYLTLKHPHVNVQYVDWKVQLFGLRSWTLDNDVGSLVQIGLLEYDDDHRDIEAIMLSSSGDYHISRVARRTLGNQALQLIEQFISRLNFRNSYRYKSDYINSKVTRSTKPTKQIGELGKTDVIEDGEFGVGYIVVNKVWIPVEAVKVCQEATIEITEDL